MSEEEDLGIKMADNPEQAFWLDLVERCEKNILESKRSILIENNVLDFAKSKVEEHKS